MLFSTYLMETIGAMTMGLGVKTDLGLGLWCMEMKYRRAGAGQLGRDQLQILENSLFSKLKERALEMMFKKAREGLEQDNTVGRVIALHIADLGMFPVIPKPTRSDSLV